MPRPDARFHGFSRAIRKLRWTRSWRRETSMLQRRRGSTPAAFVFSRSAVFADEVAEVTVDLRGFLDAGVEHGAPLPSIVVKVECSKEITGLKDDLESVAEIVGEASYLLGVLDGDRGRAGGVGHE